MGKRKSKQEQNETTENQYTKTVFRNEQESKEKHEERQEKLDK